MTARPFLQGRLDARPRPTAIGRSWAQHWVLAIGDGTEGSGPAEAASFTLPSTGITIWSDYADPGRLLQIDVPFGVVRTLGSNAERLAAGSFRADDLAVVERLLGPEVRATLEATTETTFEQAITRDPSWTAAGRIALAHTMLRDRMQPMSGLWALEVAELLAQLDAGPATADYRRALIEAATPGVSSLPVSLLPRVLSDVAPLGHLLAVTAGREGHGMGPLSDALGLHNADAISAEAQRIVDAAIPEFEPSAPSAATRAERERVHHGGQVTERPITVVVDHTAASPIQTASASLDDGEVVVTLTPRQRTSVLPHALRRLDVRVSSPEGLLATGASFRPTQAGELVASLLVPPGTLAADLFVVVGRGLPLEPLEEASYGERQATMAARRIVDHLRTMSPPPTTDLGGMLAGGAPLPRLLTDNAKRSDGGWKDVGRGDRARGVGRLRHLPPFVTELTAAALVTAMDLEDLVSIAADQPEPSDPSGETGTAAPAQLAGARDLAWSLGDIELAARLERNRYRATGTDDLPLASHDTLTLALFATHPAEAAALDLVLP